MVPLYWHSISWVLYTASDIGVSCLPACCSISQSPHWITDGKKTYCSGKCVWSSGQLVSWLELQLLVTVYCSYSSTGWPKANQASQFKCQASKISSQYVLNSKLHQSIKSICIWFASRNHLICIRFWGAKLRRLKGLSLAEMGTFGKSATPCTILYIALSFICFLLSARVGRFRLLHNIE